MNEDEIIWIQKRLEQECMEQKNLALVFGCATFILVVAFFYLLLPFDKPLNFLVGLGLALIAVNVLVKISEHQLTIRRFISNLLG